MTVWTPRPPSPDEPACWSWTVPPLRSRDEIAAELAAKGHSEGSIELILEGGGPEMHRFSEFHTERCAICGRPSMHLVGLAGEYLVQDHCHRTGQIRGRLCRSCNVREGRSRAPLFVRYRRIHPAAILDVHEMYDGMGWTWGWSWAEVGRSVDDLGFRPPSPWPAWSPDATVEQLLLS